MSADRLEIQIEDPQKYLSFGAECTGLPFLSLRVPDGT